MGGELTPGKPSSKGKCATIKSSNLTEDNRGTDPRLDSLRFEGFQLLNNYLTGGDRSIVLSEAISQPRTALFGIVSD